MKIMKKQIIKLFWTIIINIKNICTLGALTNQIQSNEKHFTCFFIVF
jgi:hypothetical protein